MGVPKFYRWISERYPTLSEVINENQIPQYDNLYLDMNGIIHNCSHPNDDDVTFRIAEDDIFVNIFAYIENLLKMIKPEKVFFMAVDGVAPRAKMNQQRARRFMSAKTTELQLKKAKLEGKELPDEKPFDSNCITPGTHFMTRLHERLASWIEKKISDDPLWQNKRIYLSGHNCPGEGEHKIMDFIRSERAKDGYDPNTRHCMYGLDADLIMLGIVSHEPHFSLLREEVKFTRGRKHDAKKKPQRIDSEVKQFHLLHLSLLREYLAWEFYSVKDEISFEFDMERIVDDWILMGLLIGNDFLPNLPNVHINDDAFPLLYSTYKAVLPKIDGYINESGYLNLKRFETFLKELSRNDKSSFMDKMEDMDFMESKKSGQNQEDDLVQFENSDGEDGEALEGGSSGVAGVEESDEEEEADNENAAFVSSDEENDGKWDTNHDSTADDDIENETLEDEFNDALVLSNFMAMDDKEFENNIEACWTRTVNNSFKRFKKNYYQDKMKYKNISKADLKAQAEGYVRAIQWNLHYYYHGCVSWSWFYPHHYAPYISDVIDFTDLKIEFDLSKPFQPFEQLLAVLPAASSDCLPKPLQELMTSDASLSTIHDFYPDRFDTDLNGKKNDWEAVVLIPFINESRLLEAIKSKINRLTKEEIKRNSHGPHLLFASNSTGSNKPVKRVELTIDEFRLDIKKVKWGLLPNVKMDVYFPGFPTMKHLEHRGLLKQAGVNIFGSVSKKDSMVLMVKNESDEKDAVIWGAELLEEEVCVDWPILKLAKVESIWVDGTIVRKTVDDEIVVKDMSAEDKKQWIAVSNQVAEKLMTRYAIEIEEKEKVKGKQQRVPIAWVRRFHGMVYKTVPDKSNKGAPILKSVKQFAQRDSVVPVLLPLIVKDLLLEQSQQFSDMPIKMAYPLQSVVWVTDPKSELYGVPAVVQGFKNEESDKCTVVLLGMVMNPQIEIMEELRSRYDSKSLRWLTGFECAKQINVNVGVFTRITGTIIIFNEPKKVVETGRQLSSESKLNVGLSLKFTKRNVCLADYTRRSDEVNARGSRAWLYSSITVRLVSQYKKTFPELFRFLEVSNDNDDVYYSEDIWPNAKVRDEKFEQLREFLKTVPSTDAEHLDCDIEYADRQIIDEIEKVILPNPEARMKKALVPPSSLFRPELYDGKTLADSDADFHVLDRVACAHSGYPIKKTMQGTIVGIHNDKIDVLFDKEFDSGSNVRGSKKASAIRLPKAALFNITYGLMRKFDSKKKKIDNTNKHGKRDPLEGAYVPWAPKNKESVPMKEVFDLSGVPTSSTSTTPISSKSDSQTKIKINFKGKSSQNDANDGEDPMKAMTDALKKQLNIVGSESKAKTENEVASNPKPHKRMGLAEMLGARKKEPQPEKTDDGEQMKILLKKIESSGKKVEEKAEIEKNEPSKHPVQASAPPQTQYSHLSSNSQSDPSLSAPPPLPPQFSHPPPFPPPNLMNHQQGFMVHPQMLFSHMPVVNTPHGPMVLTPNGEFRPPPDNIMQPIPFGMPPPQLQNSYNNSHNVNRRSPEFNHQPIQAAQQHRAAPQLTDFKPSTVSRGGRTQNQRGGFNNKTKVKVNPTNVEKEKPVEEPKPVEKTPSSSTGTSNKSKKKKQSRLAVSFGQ